MLHVKNCLWYRVEFCRSSHAARVQTAIMLRMSKRRVGLKVFASDHIAVVRAVHVPR
jgi:hypothetical protein